MLEKGSVFTNKIDQIADKKFSVSGKNLFMKREDRVLLNVAEITFCQSELNVIIGANGAGKSLLIRVLNDLVSPDRGEVLWAGEKPSQNRRCDIAMMLQAPVVLRRSVKSNLEFALNSQSGAQTIGRSERNNRLLEMIESADLGHLINTSARKLSGGEKQRLCMARALILKPKVLFLDEPSAGLDPTSTRKIENLIKSALEAGTNIVLVSHDMAQVKRLAERVIFMNEGEIIDNMPAKRFFNEQQSKIAEAYLTGHFKANSN